MRAANISWWNAHDLERKLAEFQLDYNAARSHSSLDGRTPLTFAGGHTVVPADLSPMRWVSHCRDLCQAPGRRLTANSRPTPFT